MGICQDALFFTPLNLNPRMSVVLILLAASLTVAIGFLAAFIWSVKNGQYEDDYTPSVRMLFEDKSSSTPDTTTEKPQSKQ